MSQHPRTVVHTSSIVPAWALGETRPMSDRERRLTAAVYARVPGVVEHVRSCGRIPDFVPSSGHELGLRMVIARRGIDIELSDAEHEVLDALDTHGDAPAGRAALIA
jgi:hypothetical protein